MCKKCVNIIYTFIVWYNINTAYRLFKITETTTISIDFNFNSEVNNGKYIIKKDGVTIDTGVVQ